MRMGSVVEYRPAALKHMMRATDGERMQSYNMEAVDLPLEPELPMARARSTITWNLFICILNPSYCHENAFLK